MSTFPDPTTLSHDALEEGTVFAPHFGADGLVTVVAADRAGAVLMVAHMNAEALSRTLETGEVHYYSRSRGKLWKKGETSGHVLRVREVRVDCDQDAVWLIVDPAGPACHTGEPSCFYRRVEDGRLVRVE
jgi:phosphoribosyl-AMP cyclohydrolase